MSSLRLGLNERGITEILGIAEHVTSIGVLAEGLRLRLDVPDEPRGQPTELAAPLEEAAGGDRERTLAQVRAWSRSALGIDRAPAFWRVLARRPRLLDAVWAKHQLVMGAGELDAGAKIAVALAAAMNKQSPYWTSYFAAEGRRAGVFDDDLLVELAGSVMHYVAFNTVAHGMMLEAPHREIAAGDLAPETPDKTE